MIFSDCKEAVHLLNSPSALPWNCAAEILNIKALVAAANISFLHIPRNVNLVAHWVPQRASVGSLQANWTSIFCSYLDSLVA